MIHSVASIEPEPETPYFIKPHGFRPNSIFVGRKEELAQMHQMLFDKKRREEGTSAVLLQSLPGGGKTHLARQYVFDHIKDFPGGIFWIRAKSQEQLAAGFWEIARQVALKPSTCVDASSLDPSQFVLIVKDWFGANQEWLLVLDGIHFDHTDELLRYIPDSKNSSLIFTSTEWSVVGDHHFMNPQVIKLPLLSAREAQDLFLLELNRTNPSSDELNQAMELVQRMEFLPVVIHAGVQRLNATGEPLARFARHYATGPKLRGLETFNDVVGELESADAVEALNLMRIICFFSGHVPVEMIVLGLNALETIDIHIKTYEVSSGRSLNNTFKILNRFALVERSEHNVSMRSSQSSGTSRETLIDGVDIIRLHSVVQDFFVDSLKADGHLSLWLDRAVSVFCTSYDMANRRIQRKSNSGLVVGDYRVYEIHGTRLMQHITRNEKKIAELGKTREVLDSCLKEVKQQIDTRTRTSSEDLVLGRRETFQTSIFNRSGSSSDTGPETPGSFDRESSGRLTWDTETKVQHESPVSIHEERMQYDDGLYRVPYLPYPVTEDQGYDGDRDEVMTERPLQRSTSPDLSAETQRTLARRRHPRDRSSHVDLHRTIRAMERNRYRDSAGAWRQVNARVPDPRVSHETANPKDWSRTTSNGPVPGKSSAQAVLSHISKNSPPPLNFRGFRDHRPPSTLSSPRSETGGYLSSSNVPPAVDDALPQELPLLSTRGRSTSRASLTPLEIPAISVPTPTPYPVENRLPIVSDSLGMQTSPSLVYGQPYPIAGMAVYGPPRVFVPENLPVVTPSQQYPRQVGPLPIEYVASTSYPIWNPVNSPITTTQQGTIINHIDPAPQALFPDENRLDSNYIYHSGYTSQPLSRNGSNQSAGTVAAGVKNRRPSLAESEPMPQLPNFSPRIAPTSYQMYEDLALVPRSELDELRSGSNQGGRGRSRFRWAGWRTPRLGFGHAALIERVDQWVPQNEYAGSENSSDTGPAPSVSRTRSQPSLGTRPARLSQSPLSGISNIMLSDNEAPAMSRSTSGSASGGVRVGNRVVAFGDKVTPSAVDRLRSELTSSEAVDGLGPPYDVVSGIGRRARGLSSPERPR
ncbi:MAG: hypothetical protein M1818_003108 [Claussenomyces sp. TS43310]|nr:MAG: hypothetical protein M1818_003108 [Claussenomyces sp. TS43310]